MKGLSMLELLPEDLERAVRNLPKDVERLLKNRSKAIVAGGYLRSVVSGDPINDIDIFAPSKEHAYEFAGLLGDNVKESRNAFTVSIPGVVPIQVIHRWTFEKPEDVIFSFDFTTAQAALWHGILDGWVSTTSPRFYPDLAARRLVYTAPVRNEDAGGSLLRVFKFAKRGYRVPLDSLAGVVTRLVAQSGITESGITGEVDIKRVIVRQLRLVDPVAPGVAFDHEDDDEDQPAEV